MNPLTDVGRCPRFRRRISREKRTSTLPSPACTDSYHCHFPTKRPTFSPVAACSPFIPATDQSARFFSASRRLDPQRGTARRAASHRGTCAHLVVSYIHNIRVATLGEVGQFSPVRGIGSIFANCIFRSFVPISGAITARGGIFARAYRHTHRAYILPIGDVQRNITMSLLV